MTAPFVFFSVATQSRAQSQDENANATAPLYKTVSIQPTKSNVNADRSAKVGPDELTATNLSTQELIQGAYDVKDDQIVGAPSWVNSRRYDIEAKADNPAAAEDGEHMLERGVLSNYFKLAVHRETRLIPGYEIVMAGGGPSFKSQFLPTQIPPFA